MTTSSVSNYDTLMKKKMNMLEKEISLIKQEFSKVGHMHPGTLSLQKRSHGGEYHQLSYSFAGKGHTHYVRSDDVDEVRESVANYRKFRELTNCWIELEIAFAKASRSAAKRVPNDSTKCRRDETSGSSHK